MLRDVPFEILNSILGFGTVQCVCAAHSVCSEWYWLLTDHEDEVWKPLLYNTWPIKTTENITLPTSQLNCMNGEPNDLDSFEVDDNFDFTADGDILLPWLKQPQNYNWKAEFKALWTGAHSAKVIQTIDDTHSDEIWFTNFSHNGEMLFTCSKNGEIVLWQVETLMSKKWIPINTLDQSTRDNLKTSSQNKKDFRLIAMSAIEVDGGVG